MPESVLLVDRQPPVALVTLNRPQQMNALSSELRLAIGHALAQLEADQTIRAVVLTGAGRAFCAGMDLAELSSGGSEASGYDLAVAGQDEMRDGLAGFSGALIAAVNGAAATAGFELALACDLIIASTHAKFLDTHARVGILPGWGLSVRLPRLIGMARAKEVSLSGNALQADRAHEWGLVNRVVESGELIEESLALARDMASCLPGLMEDYKRLIEEGAALPLPEALERERAIATESSKQIASTEIAGRRADVQSRGRSQSGKPRPDG